MYIYSAQCQPMAESEALGCLLSADFVLKLTLNMLLK